MQHSSNFGGIEWSETVTGVDATKLSLNLIYNLKLELPYPRKYIRYTEAQKTLWEGADGLMDLRYEMFTFFSICWKPLVAQGFRLMFGMSMITRTCFLFARDLFLFKS